MTPRRSIAGPVLLIVIGFVLLLNTIRPGLPLLDWFFNYWPYLLIFSGVLQLAEVLYRFQQNRPVPVNGVSGGAWFLVLLVCIAGFAGFHVRHAYPWWRGETFLQGVDAFGREHEFSVTTQQRAVTGSPHLVIENFRGDAKITVDPGSAVTLSGRKLIRALDDNEADRANAASPVELITRGDTVIVRCHQATAGGKARVTTNLELTVPRNTSVEATGTRGDFDITGLHGDIDLSSENAGVRLQDIDGSVKIDTRDSDVVRCSAVHGPVTLRGHGEDVELTRIDGPVTVNGAYSGRVTLRQLLQPVHVSNMRTDFTLRKIPGEVQMDRGEINLQNVAGPVTLNTKVTDVKLENFSDRLDLTVDKGDVELRLLRMPLPAIAVRTHSGNIALDLPGSAGFSLDAQTTHGEISNEFGGLLRQTDAGRGAHLQGSIAGLGVRPDVRLMTDRGSITIRKSDAITAAAATDTPEDPQ